MKVCVCVSIKQIIFWNNKYSMSVLDYLTYLRKMYSTFTQTRWLCLCPSHDDDDGDDEQNISLYQLQKYSLSSVHGSAALQHADDDNDDADDNDNDEDDNSKRISLTINTDDE